MVTGTDEDEDEKQLLMEDSHHGDWGRDASCYQCNGHSHHLEVEAKLDHQLLPSAADPRHKRVISCLHSQRADLRYKSLNLPSVAESRPPIQESHNFLSFGNKITQI